MFCISYRNVFRVLEDRPTPHRWWSRPPTQANRHRSLLVRPAKCVMQIHDFGHIGETYLRSEFDVTHNLLSTSCQSLQRQIEGKPKRRFMDVFEPTKTIGDVRLGRDTFESVCDASSVMPRPMSRNEAIVAGAYRHP
eukprot:s4481_g2.t1